MTRTGLDLMEKWLPLVKGKRVALVTSPASVDSNYRDSVEVLASSCKLAALLGPEHGVRGEVRAGDGVASGIDAFSGIPIYSLYDGHGVSIGPYVADIADVIVFDIQDLGLRFYTYIATLKGVMEDCAKLGLPLIVLDRPNPLGAEVFGSLLSPADFSFVGPDALPVRYGLTIGELALWFNSRFKVPASLTVIPMQNYKRTYLWRDTGRIWVPSSPAIGSFESAFCYAGFCLLEGTNISEGRGTATPFQCFGAPFADAIGLCDYLNGIGLDGMAFLPKLFIPDSGKWAGKTCEGAFIVTYDMHKANPIKAAVLAICYFSSHFREFEVKPGLARLAGSCDAEAMFENPEHLIRRWESDGRRFGTETQEVHLYE